MATVLSSFSKAISFIGHGLHNYARHDPEEKHNNPKEFSYMLGFMLFIKITVVSRLDLADPGFVVM